MKVKKIWARLGLGCLVLVAGLVILVVWSGHNQKTRLANMTPSEKYDYWYDVRKDPERAAWEYRNALRIEKLAEQRKNRASDGRTVETRSEAALESTMPKELTDLESQTKRMAENIKARQ